MERNHICKKCGGIAGWDSYFQSWICTRCGNQEPKPSTNYDRIISKSLEELAEYLAPCACPPIRFNKNTGDIVCPENKEPSASDCKTCWLDWLKQEATELDT